jgi:anti-sigma factor ChrR (cupin superfamily)
MMSDDLRSRSIQILLNQAATPQYPSVSMLDRIEAAVNDREAANEYVGLLLDMLEKEAYPSPMMLDRVMGLIETLERSAPRQE